MSQENVEIVRRAWEYEMFGRRGGRDPLADFAPDVVMNPVEEEPSYGREAIRDNFDMSATRYYQVLNALIDKPEALAQAPLLVKRLRRLRAARQRFRSAKRLGIDLSID